MSISKFTQRLRACFVRPSGLTRSVDRFERGLAILRQCHRTPPQMPSGSNPRRLTIALDVTRIFDEYLTGISYYCIELARALSRRADVSIVFISERPLPSVATGDLPLYAVAADRQIAYGPDAARAPTVEDMTGPIDIYLHTSANSESHLAARRSIAVIYDIAPVVCPETASPPIVDRCDRYYRHRAVTDTAFIAISEFTRTEFSRHYGVANDRIVVIPPGIDPLFTPASNDRADLRVLHRHAIPGNFMLCVGTLQPRKNLERLIAASGLLREKGIPLPQLVLIGARISATTNDFAARLAGLEAAHKVQWAGYVAREDLPAFYRRCAAFLYPSYYEGYGLPVAEALACGAAVICGDRSSLPEVGGNAVRYCDPLSVTAIADAIHAVVNAPAEQTRLRAATISRVAALPSWDLVAARIIDVCRSAVR